MNLILNRRRDDAPHTMSLVGHDPRIDQGCRRCGNAVGAPHDEFCPQVGNSVLQSDCYVPAPRNFSMVRSHRETSPTLGISRDNAKMLLYTLGRMEACMPSDEVAQNQVSMVKACSVLWSVLGSDTGPSILCVTPTVVAS